MALPKKQHKSFSAVCVLCYTPKNGNDLFLKIHVTFIMTVLQLKFLLGALDVQSSDISRNCGNVIAVHLRLYSLPLFNQYSMNIINTRWRPNGFSGEWSRPIYEVLTQAKVCAKSKCSENNNFISLDKLPITLPHRTCHLYKKYVIDPDYSLFV